MHKTPLTCLLAVSFLTCVPARAQEHTDQQGHGGAGGQQGTHSGHGEQLPADPGNLPPAPPAPDQPPGGGGRPQNEPPLASPQWEEKYHEVFHEVFHTEHDGKDDFDAALSAVRDPKASPQERLIAQDVLKFGARYVSITQNVKDPDAQRAMLDRLAQRFETTMTSQWNRLGGGADGHAHKMDQYKDIVDKLCSGRCADAHAGHMAGQPNAGAPTLNWAADTFLKQNRPEKAAQLATQAMEKDPGSAKALKTRAQARYKMEDFQGAYEDARGALRLDPKDAEAYSVMKLSEKRVAAPSQAGARSAPSPGLQTAAAPAAAPLPAPSSFRPMDEAAASYAIKDYARAIREADAALRLNPKDAGAFVTRAMSNYRLGGHEAALRDAEAALSLSPGNQAALKAKVYSLSGLREHARVREAALEYLRLYGEDADVRFKLAAAQWGLGHRQETIDSLRLAAETDPLRYRRFYEEAIQAGPNGDLSYLFDEAPATARPGRVDGSRGLGSWWAVFVGAAGLLLVAGGLWLGVAGRGSEPGTVSAHPPTKVFPMPQTPSPANGGADGDVIAGNYQIRRVLGSGGMGTVYEAMDTRLQRVVAMKRMRDEIRSDPRERERFLKEARLVASLRHPNIVEIYSIVEEGGQVYLVFEYVEGKTLSDFLAEKWRLPWGEACRLLKPVAAALEYAHRRDVIHRDLKPSNVMLDREGTVKVMDFGVARQAKDAMTRLAMTNTVVGTPPYMAPEAEQGMVRKESDLYSLGICLYELLTGQLPFVGTGAGMLLNKMNLSFAPASELVPGLPPALDALVSRALQPDPDKRLRTAGEFLEALEAAARLGS